MKLCLTCLFLRVTFNIFMNLLLFTVTYCTINIFLLKSFVFLGVMITNSLIFFLDSRRMCIKNSILMDLEKVSNDENQVVEARSDEEQNHTASNILLSQSDLIYLIDTVGEISNDGIENCFLDTPVNETETPRHIPKNNNDIPICENETLRQVPENGNEGALVTTPIPSPCRTFGDTVSEFNYLSESSVILSDATLRSSPLGSSEMSGSSTPHHRKKKASVRERSNNKKQNY